MKRKNKRCVVFLIAIALIISSFFSVFVNSGHQIEESEENEMVFFEGYDDIYSETVTDRSPYPFPDHYPSVLELYDWYDDLVLEFPDLVTKTHIGNSYEGRDLWMLEITSDEDVQVDEKPGVLIDGGMHAREWSGPQVASYLMWRLLNEYDTNETIYWLLNNRIIYIMPMQNPDGYIYDGDGVYEDRAAWRKNRNASTPTSAVGVDLNRNWDIAWEGGNTDPSSDTYRGEAPFSEYENWHLRDFMLSRDIQSYQNIHSYAGTLLIPLMYSTDPSPHDDWYRGMADHMTSQTSRLGDEDWHYSYGQPHEEIGYTATGGVVDWVYDAIGATGLCFEIHTGGSGYDGFYPDPSLIMTINQDLDNSLIYQSRVADTDLGDSTTNLYPPVPYILYGKVTDTGGSPVIGMEVTLENLDTGETLSITTDANGYYEMNYGNLVEQGYSLTDTFSVSAWTSSEEFTIGDEWGRRIDLEVIIEGDPPEITVISPNGGEEWYAHTDEDITWTTTQGEDPVDYIDLWYSVDNGASWTSIDSGLPDSSSYTWTVPNDDSSECLVRARAVDTMGRWAEDISDGVFDIVGVAPMPPENLLVEHVSAPYMAVFDDFADGNYDGWTVYDGTWDASNGYLQGSGSISTPAELNGEPIDAYGRWEYDFQLSEVSDDYGYQLMRTHFIQIDDPDSRYASGYYVIITGQISGGDGQINLWRWDNGDTPGETVTSGSWSPDTDVHTLAIEREESGAFTIYLDGTSLGSGTDNTYTTNEYMGLRHSENPSGGPDHIIHEIRVETTGDGDEHNLLTWNPSPDETLGEVSHYNIYCSEFQSGPWDGSTLIDSVSADGLAEYEYLDMFKGMADEIYWWYVVRAVGTNGLEEQNSNAVQEPGAPSETFDIPLYAGGDAGGWNFVSFNLIPTDTSLETILADIDGNYDKLMFYDASTGEWSSYVPGRADRYNNLDTWNHQMGMWVHMTTSDTLTITGTVPASTDITLQPGWTMVGLPSETTGNHELPGEVDRIGYFDGTQTYNLAYDNNPGVFEFEPGNGYWLYNPTDTAVVWTVDY